MRIRYSEIFYSFQGEAELSGYPAVWLRFFGCNLNCNGFGQQDPTDPSSYVLPYMDFDGSGINDVKQLPVWTTGCDSSYSWSVKYKHLANDGTVESICDRLVDANKSEHNPEGLFVHPLTHQPIMLCFTGGEPMMQQKAMIEIIKELKARNNMPEIVTVETNATKTITDELKEFLTRPGGFRDLGGSRWHFAMSPKLFTVSGEQNVVDPEIIHSYSTLRYGVTSILKFVCNGTINNWLELDKHLNNIKLKFDPFPMPNVWVMPVGATKDSQEREDIGNIAIEAMNRGYNVATRNHCYVFGNVIGR